MKKIVGPTMISLPEEYIQYLASANTMWGETDYEFGGYFELKPLEMVAQMNSDIQIQEYAPGFVAFASDGGGEVFVFDKSGAVYLMPLIGMEPSVAIKLAESWSQFAEHIRNAQQGA